MRYCVYCIVAFAEPVEPTNHPPCSGLGKEGTASVAHWAEKHAGFLQAFPAGSSQNVGPSCEGKMWVSGVRQPRACAARARAIAAGFLGFLACRVRAVMARTPPPVPRSRLSRGGLAVTTPAAPLLSCPLAPLGLVLCGCCARCYFVYLCRPPALVRALYAGVNLQRLRPILGADWDIYPEPPRHQ